jgi:uncharacterized membrane protein
MARKGKSNGPQDAPESAAKKPDPARAPGDGREIEDAQLVGRTVTIARPREEVYAFWRHFENLPRFMENVESIEATGPERARWTVKAPAGKTVSWESIITSDQPGHAISWESTPESEIQHHGQVSFTDAPARRGTQVTATIVYHPPGGSVGRLVAKAFQREPEIQARRDLRRFKQLLETGEVSTAQAGAAAPRGE